MVSKILKSVKENGLIGTIKKVLRTIKYKFILRDRDKIARIIKDYVKVSKFENIIIFENNFGWNKIMKQRPQQIAENLPENTLMFYHSYEDKDYIGNKRIRKLKDNLILIDLGYYRDVLLKEITHDNKYLMIYSTDYIPYDRIKMYENYGYNVIYEFVDDLNEKLCGEEMYKVLKERHDKLIKDDIFVVCTATELYKKVYGIKKDCCTLITNGGNYDHFKSAEYNVPNDMIEIKEKYPTILCYYGALASWFDYDLIKKISNNKSLAIVLLGQEYDETLSNSHILDIDNVFYLGKKEYEELPSYGCNSDVFLIPFLVNSITLATSPVKIFEYMAMEKPIITTALPECKKYKSVLYSKNHDEFIKNIDKALKLENNRDYKALLRKEAKENDWISKAAHLVEFISSAKYNLAKEKVDEIFEKNNFERVIVWRSPFGWNVPLFQRPQHIARQFAKQKCLVLYEVTPSTDDVLLARKEEENLFLVNFQNKILLKALEEKYKSITKPKYLQIYSTNWSMSVAELHEYEKSGFKILYEYIDDISPELAGTSDIPTYVLDKYNYAMENDDVLVVTTAKELYNDVKNKRNKKNLAFACNGVDYAFFQKIDKKFNYEHQFLKVINNGKINICYYGALASWFDYELIRKINATNKYNIILFGIKYDSSYDKSKINKLKNVYFFGARDYSILKNYAYKMDVLMIPFVINSITQATSPLKLFEYMALHKPIVTTAMNECKNYKSVMVAENHEQFLHCLSKFEKLKNDKKYLNLLDKEAKENDWKEKAKTIIDLLKESEK